MFLLRNVTTQDIDGLLALAEMLNTLNLPYHRPSLEQQIQHSIDSFTETITDPRKREYLFVAEDLSSGKIVGTSMVIAQHGTKESPHLYFEVIEDQRYSSTLDKHFHHLILRLGRNFDGPTEIGGLILHPQYRAGAYKLGKQLSFVRFLFIGMHKKWFRKKLLAELLPPLLEDGTSLLWEHLGRHFTGLDYRQADYISRTNKEFIISLFPSGDMYASLLPSHVQAVIGAVGDSTQGVKKMLESVGFEYSQRIDPFDGGPHFEIDTHQLKLFAHTKKLEARISIEDVDCMLLPPSHLVGVFDHQHTIPMRACACRPQLLEHQVLLSSKVASVLQLSPKQRVFVMPLEIPQEIQLDPLAV